MFSVIETKIINIAFLIWSLVALIFIQILFDPSIYFGRYKNKRNLFQKIYLSSYGFLRFDVRSFWYLTTVMVDGNFFAWLLPVVFHASLIESHASTILFKYIRDISYMPHTLYISLQPLFFINIYYTPKWILDFDFSFNSLQIVLKYWHQHLRHDIQPLFSYIFIKSNQWYILKLFRLEEKRSDKYNWKV